MLRLHSTHSCHGYLDHHEWVLLVLFCRSFCGAEHADLELSDHVTSGNTLTDEQCQGCKLLHCPVILLHAPCLSSSRVSTFVSLHTPSCMKGGGGQPSLQETELRRNPPSSLVSSTQNSASGLRRRSETLSFLWGFVLLAHRLWPFAAWRWVSLRLH